MEQPDLQRLELLAQQLMLPDNQMRLAAERALFQQVTRAVSRRPVSVAARDIALPVAWPLCSSVHACSTSPPHMLPPSPSPPRRLLSQNLFVCARQLDADRNATVFNILKLLRTSAADEVFAAACHTRARRD